MSRTRFFAPVARHLVATMILGLLLLPALAFADPCQVPDNGGGTVYLPPAGCGYVSPADLHKMLDVLAPGTHVFIDAKHDRFFNVTHTPTADGGEDEQYGSNLQLHLKGQGFAYDRILQIPNVQCKTHTKMRTPWAHVQSFDTEMLRINGQLPPGDPDFDLLRITAGSDNGMPASLGHTTLTKMGPNWAVDSFFDITYLIEWQGAAGGPFAGHSGSTTATIRMGAGEPAPNPCISADNGTGTVDLPPGPPANCPYLSPADVHMIIDGLPAGTEIHLGAAHQEFFNISHQPDPVVPGGEIEQFGSNLNMRLKGTGTLDGYMRNLNLQAQCETHVGPRTPGQPFQSFDTEMFRLQGELPPGDPDFDLLRIVAGTGFGMPSPGHTTLTKIPGTNNWNVDSFFDIEYQIDFVGAPGGPLAGHSGSTTATIRMQTGQPSTTGVPIGNPTQRVELSVRPNPFGSGTTAQYRIASGAKIDLKIYDAAGHLVRSLVSQREPAGPHAMYWDGRNDAGRKVGSGTYFIKLAVDGKIAATRRATLVR